MADGAGARNDFQAQPVTVYFRKANSPDQFSRLTNIDGAKARAFADEFNVPRVVSDLAELCAMDDLAIIDICTPPGLHFGHVRQALDRAGYKKAMIVGSGSAFIARYALGRDYHKVLRNRLQRLIDRLRAAFGDYAFRAFTDSAPVLEVALAAKSGIGWRGKHTLVLHRDAGSMFFLGEIYVDLPLPVTAPVDDRCGSCRACLDVCPTQAIVAPYRLDARRCISYLTIEHRGVIAEDLRPLMGNRIYGCDDCLAVCPWNKFAVQGREAKLAARSAPGMGCGAGAAARSTSWTFSPA